MRTRKALVIGVVLMTLVGALVGCGRSGIRIGWLEADGLRHKTARYRLFEGLERASVRAQSGETIELDYEVEVERGTLTLILLSPDGEQLWKETFEQDAADTVHLSAPQSGRYELRIEGNSTRGAFDVSWQTGTD